MSGMTVLLIPDSAIDRIAIIKGTVVYKGNAYYTLPANQMVSIEARGATNYDNQRRATDPDTGLHLFWVCGPFRTAAAPALPPAAAEARGEPLHE